jgi:Rrf2 family cysteine metabolism transcriptional repressor
MRITRKSDYGLRAMYELAKSYGRSPVSITEIAAAQNIPDPFLEKIMQELKSAGLIVATHGRGGGYSLDRAPARVSVREVVEALEGKVALVTCLDPSLKCMIEEGCPTSGFWTLINERFEQALGATTLADLLESAPISHAHSPRPRIPEESGLSQ